MFLALNVELGVLLETAFDTVLQEMGESASRERVLVPDSLLLAPLASKMSADLRLELFPVKTVKAMQTDHVELVGQVVVVMVADSALEDVHFGARG